MVLLLDGCHQLWSYWKKKTVPCHLDPSQFKVFLSNILIKYYQISIHYITESSVIGSSSCVGGFISSCLYGLVKLLILSRESWHFAYWFPIHVGCWKVRQKGFAYNYGNSTNDRMDFNLLRTKPYLLDSFTFLTWISRFVIIISICVDFTSCITFTGGGEMCKLLMKFIILKVKNVKRVTRILKPLATYKDLSLCLPGVTTHWSTSNPPFIRTQDPTPAWMMWENSVV